MGHPPTLPTPKNNMTNPTNTDIQTVFNHWVKQTWNGKGRKPILGTKRQTKIRARLREGYTTTELKTAIDGVLNSPFHMGHNDRGQKYTDIVTILRDDAQVEKFIQLAQTNNYLTQPNW